jgi:hypothetical protein
MPQHRIVKYLFFVAFLYSQGTAIATINQNTIVQDSVEQPSDTILLSDVIVTAHKHDLKRTGNKFIFNPNSLKQEVSNTYELIKLTPLLSVSGNSYSILGKGNSKVYINGRDSKMDSEALTEMLKAIPATQINSIEIITQPGSSQTASNTSGIINVIVDDPTQGYLGSI